MQRVFVIITKLIASKIIIAKRFFVIILAAMVQEPRDETLKTAPFSHIINPEFRGNPQRTTETTKTTRGNFWQQPPDQNHPLSALLWKRSASQKAQWLLFLWCFLPAKPAGKQKNMIGILQFEDAAILLQLQPIGTLSCCWGGCKCTFNFRAKMALRISWHQNEPKTFKNVLVGTGGTHLDKVHCKGWNNPENLLGSIRKVQIVL